MNALDLHDGNIMIVGVGGQGTLVASKLLGKMLLENGKDVKVSEVHGMSQRGGSVVTYVRFSDKKVYSPVVDMGQADFVISFELLEGARYVSYLKKGGVLVVNTQQINPMPVITGSCSYPESLLDKLCSLDIKVDSLDALSEAEKTGSSKCVNLVLLGRLSRYFSFSEEQWIKTIESSVPEKFLEMNKKAFMLGRNA